MRVEDAARAQSDLTERYWSDPDPDRSGGEAARAAQAQIGTKVGGPHGRGSETRPRLTAAVLEEALEGLDRNDLIEDLFHEEEQLIQVRARACGRILGCSVSWLVCNCCSGGQRAFVKVARTSQPRHNVDKRENMVTSVDVVDSFVPLDPTGFTSCGQCCLAACPPQMVECWL